MSLSQSLGLPIDVPIEVPTPVELCLVHYRWHVEQGGQAKVRALPRNCDQCGRAYIVDMMCEDCLDWKRVCFIAYPCRCLFVPHVHCPCSPDRALPI